MGDEEDDSAPTDADSDDQVPPYDEETQKLIEGSSNILTVETSTGRITFLKCSHKFHDLV